MFPISSPTNGRFVSVCIVSLYKFQSLVYFYKQSLIVFQNFQNSLSIVLIFASLVLMMLFVSVSHTTLGSSRKKYSLLRSWDSLIAITINFNYKLYYHFCCLIIFLRFSFRPKGMKFSVLHFVLFY